MNPILQMLTNKATNNLLNQITSINNPNAIYNQLMNSNPQFRQFVEQNKGKSPEEIAQNYGVDIQQLKQLFR